MNLWVDPSRQANNSEWNRQLIQRATHHVAYQHPGRVGNVAARQMRIERHAPGVFAFEAADADLLHLVGETLGTISPVGIVLQERQGRSSTADLRHQQRAGTFE